MDHHWLLGKPHSPHTFTREDLCFSHTLQATPGEWCGALRKVMGILVSIGSCKPLLIVPITGVTWMITQ